MLDDDVLPLPVPVPEGEPMARVAETPGRSSSFTGGPQHDSEARRSDPRPSATGTLVLVTFERIRVDPGKMGGVPCIRDLRMPVATVVAMVADGMTVDEILAEFPDLEAEDVQEALHFAAETLLERTLPITSTP